MTDVICPRISCKFCNRGDSRYPYVCSLPKIENYMNGECASYVMG